MSPSTTPEEPLEPCGYCVRGVYQSTSKSPREVCPYCDGAGVPVSLCVKLIALDVGDCDDPARFVTVEGWRFCGYHAQGHQPTETHPQTPEALALSKELGEC